MMDQMMGGGMNWGMGLLGVLVIIVLLIAAAALVKYLFFRKSRKQRTLLRARPRERSRER